MITLFHKNYLSGPRICSNKDSNLASNHGKYTTDYIGWAWSVEVTGCNYWHIRRLITHVKASMMWAMVVKCSKHKLSEAITLGVIIIQQSYVGLAHWKKPSTIQEPYRGLIITNPG